MWRDTARAYILDYGCGYGRITNTLVEHGYQYVQGVDFSERMIEKGRCLYPHLNLKVVLSPQLPYVDGEFDAVAMLKGIYLSKFILMP